MKPSPLVFGLSIAAYACSSPGAPAGADAQVEPPRADASPGDAAEAADAALADSVRLETSGSLGPRLVDGDGMTLYYFASDVPGTDDADPVSGCTGGCVGSWPLFHTDEIRVSAPLQASDFGEMIRTDGAVQTTYRGWPLYYYAQDLAPLQVGGQGVGNKWFVIIDPFYTVMLAHTDTLGQFLVDESGMTLYYFTRDIPGSPGSDPVSACVGGCLSFWPIFHASEARATGTLDARFGDFVRPDGSAQSTYDGWPLYHFANDVAPIQTAGEGVGNRWFVLKDPAYTMQVMTAGSAQRLTDGDGMTLYINPADTQGDGVNPPVSACTGTCVDDFPAFDIATHVVPSGIDPADFVSFSRGDGTSQLAFKGWPLYRHAGDLGPGDIHGDDPPFSHATFDPFTL